MKSVMISINPKRCEKIASDEKTIEVRKTIPKIDTPFKCYIYCTQGENLWRTQKGVQSKTELAGYLMNGKVIGEFVCDWITEITPNCDIEGCVNQYTHGYPAILGDNDCLSFNDMKAYLGNKKGYGLHISDLKIYDKPKELSEFYRPCSYSGICYSCNRFRPNGTPNDKPNDFCDSTITRAPQSWCYAEEI